MQQRQLNPYAPTTIETELTVPNANDFPESGIQFVGNLDVNEVRKVDRVSLAIGLAIGLAFAGMLAVGAVSALTGGQLAGSRLRSRLDDGGYGRDVAGGGRICIQPN